ncbi:SIMPL domain-containing protein [Consotaella aegiceratis]|uniref:SIMPL domain-containing protein n=1 Tax=Consotaella aegiceratis TaxID=3097961 RepID=UPI002F3E9652
MRTTLSRLVGCSLLAVALAGPVLAQERLAPTEARVAAKPVEPGRISVGATGEATAQPDMAMTSFTVLREGETARAALDAANDAMAEVIAGMKDLGIEARDLQTSGFSIDPQYRQEAPSSEGTRNPPQIVGYEVRNSLSVRVRDLGQLGTVLDKAVTLGVNQGGNISFLVADSDATEQAARRDAVTKARAAAQTLAEAAGVTLGRVMTINEGGGPVMPMPMERATFAMAADAKASVPIETGENTVRVSVNVVFEIEQ